MKSIYCCLLMCGVLAHTAQAQGIENPPPGDLLATGKWSSRFTISGFTGHDGFAPVVFDFARGPEGQVLATGRFQWIGNKRVDPLVRLDGDRWKPAKEDWSRDVPEIGFSAIAVNREGQMALSTNSGPFGAVPAEIWLVTGDEVRVIGGLRGSVRSMVWFDGKLWVAGLFQMANGASNLAVWNGTAWSAPPGGAADRAVYRLNVSGDSLLLAGDFTTVGGIAARGIAELSREGWKAYDLAPPIQAMHVYTVTRGEDGQLYAGGAITGGVLKWNGTAWERLGGGVFVGRYDGVVSDMVMHKGGLYVTGCFSHLNGPSTEASSIPAQSVARWTGAQWESLDDGTEPIGTSWFEYNVCGFEPSPYTAWDMRYQRLFSDGDQVYLGGTMPGAGGVPSQSIVAYDGQQWRSFSEPRKGLSGYAKSIAIGGPQRAVHIFGATHAGNEHSKSGVFRQENGSWKAIGGPLPQGLQCQRMAVDPAGTVYLGCNTPLSGGPGTPVVLSLNGDQWQPLGEIAAPGIIQDLAIDHAGQLWVVGGVRTGNATGSGFLARWDQDHFTMVEDGFNSMVFRVAFPPTGSVGPPQVMVGGAFTHIDNAEYSRVAKWNGGSWEAVGGGLSTAVLALAWAEDAVYISTETTQDSSAKHILFGRWDGSQWVELGTPENGLPAPREKTVHSIRDLLAYGKYVIAAGSIWPETGGRNVFVFDGTRITSLGGGLNAISIDTIALSRGKLWFGGQIAEAGNGEERVPSIGIARYSVEKDAEEPSEQ